MVFVNLIPGPRRICKICGKRLPYDAFYKAKGCKDGIRPECKQCTLDRQAKYYQENREDRIEHQKRYYLANSESIKEYHRDRRANDPVYQHNARQTNLRGRKRHRRLRAQDPILALVDKIRYRLWRTFKSQGKNKKSALYDWLGYSQSELHTHLHAFLNMPCPGCGIMLTMDNAEIDHIEALATAKTEADVWKLNRLSNLRLLCGPCNKRWPRPLKGQSDV